MREFHAEGITSAQPHWSIPWLLRDRLATHPDAVYVERRQSIGGGWTPVTVAANRNCPGYVGVPVISPPELSDSPGGMTLPKFRLQVPPDVEFNCTPLPFGP